jgi:hypothetical protein
MSTYSKKVICFESITAPTRILNLVCCNLLTLKYYHIEVYGISEILSSL